MAENNDSGQAVKPNILPAMKWDEVQARAQRIVDMRGFPPYKAIPPCSNFLCRGTEEESKPILSVDEAAVLSDFVYFWQPYLTLKEKPSGS